MTFVRSVLFFLYFVVVSVVIHLAALPTLVLPRITVVRMSQAWSRAVLWGLKVFAGCDIDVRGEIPKGPVLVAAKHMSIWDTIAIYMLIEDVCFVVKRELLRIPFYGWFINRAGVIGIDRAAGSRALRQMASQAKPIIAAGRPIIIFPEGTRKKPGAVPDYKPGVAALYGLLGVPCIPTALNSGQYWTGFRKNKGTIVIEFLPAIAAGLKRDKFMVELEQRIETAMEKLLAEGRTELGEG